MNLLQWRKTLIKKKYYSWSDIEKMCHQITVQLYNSAWKPDLILGITRGGNVPATILSNMLNIPADAIKISLRDDDKVVDSNPALAEQAFGLKEREMPTTARGKKILIVDDINDTGRTLNGIHDVVCSEGLNECVTYVSLLEKMSSDFSTQICAKELDEEEGKQWIVFPYEEWWNNKTGEQRG